MEEPRERGVHGRRLGRRAAGRRRPGQDQRARPRARGPPGHGRADYDSWDAQQKWAITPVAGVGGYPGSPYFKITIAGTDRALAATADAELVVVPAFTGGPEQLWRLDQLADGTYRVMPKAVPNAKEPLALSAIGSSTPTLAAFRTDGDRQRWLLKTP